MGRIVSNFCISLDGVVESPGKWHFPYLDDAMGAIIGQGMSTTGFLMGRKLYDEWSSYWPEQQPGGDEFGGFINAIPKYVLSTTLADPTWQNSTVFSDDVAARVQQLKDSTDGDITMSGSATTARWLLANGLLDELALGRVRTRHGRSLSVRPSTHHRIWKPNPGSGQDVTCPCSRPHLQTVDQTDCRRNRTGVYNLTIPCKTPDRLKPLCKRRGRRYTHPSWAYHCTRHPVLKGSNR